MTPAVKKLAVTLFIFAVLLSIVTGIAAIMLKPERSDLLAFAGFLILSGVITLGLSFYVSRSGLPSWVHSVRAHLFIISIIVTVLVVANIGFTSYLMFISPHDLGILISLIVFSFGLAAVASFYLSGPLTMNLNKLISTVRQISTGNLEVKVPVTSQDEVGELADSFNSMLARLRESLERERNMEKARREFVEAISHDLRTPLSAIRAIIESINDGVVSDDETIKRYLHTAQSEIEKLSQLVNDLFELSQIDAGLLTLDMDSIHLQELVNDTVEALTAQAAASRLKLERNIDDSIPPVNVDPRRVQRVLYNLMQNAMRHTPPDGSIQVSALDRGENVEIKVADTGEGIPEEELTKIFERSYRSDQSRSRRSGGAGLGLSIARGIVEAHGGRIWVESKPGQGSVFSFSLPKMSASQG